MERFNPTIQRSDREHKSVIWLKTVQVNHEFRGGPSSKAGVIRSREAKDLQGQAQWQKRMRSTKESLERKERLTASECWMKKHNYILGISAVKAPSGYVM